MNVVKPFEANSRVHRRSEHRHYIGSFIHRSWLARNSWNEEDYIAVAFQSLCSSRLGSGCAWLPSLATRLAEANSLLVEVVASMAGYKVDVDSAMVLRFYQRVDADEMVGHSPHRGRNAGQR